ncbi:MAG: sugar ABC transporter permease [Chloroflexi bacterium]|nr:sugar ABC transporter permease [Chloroflexota bacterium]
MAINLGAVITGRTIYQRQKRIAVVFLFPSILYVVLMFGAPAVYALYLSMVDWGLDGPRAFVWFENYYYVATDDRFWSTVVNTVYFTLLEVPGTIICALAVAMALQSSVGVRGRNLFRLVYFLPVVTSLVAVAYMWLYLYNPTIGVFNSLLMSVGLPRQQWLSSTEQVIPSLAVIDIWARLGFDMVIFVAGLEGIPRDYYDAAEIDGASGWDRFWRITLPLLNPQIVLVAVLEAIHALRIFALPYVATSGGPADASRTVVMQVYDQAFRWNNMGEAAVTSIYLFVAILIVSVVQRKVLTRAVEY